MKQDEASDYGSDFTPDEEEILRSLLQQTPPTVATYPGLVLNDLEDNEGPQGAKVHWLHVRQQQPGSSQSPTQKHTPHLPIEVADNSVVPPHIESPDSPSRRDRHERSVSIEATVDPPPETVERPEEPDLRSPLERFRTKPKKALSVTDLVSPSWCELQYWFTLTKYGKKKRTPAMKQGSAVHKNLEDEVHRTVAVDIQTKEDAWGLRIWNAIQGLRTLRETGMTRELEVWGVFDGLLVNGVIDELSYECPDRELEASIEVSPKKKNSKDPPPPPTDQKTITDFLSPNGSRNINQIDLGLAAQKPPAKETTSRIYITDTKTRSAASLPKGASFRPTLMQLMLYHRLLTTMATTAFDPSVLFSHYDLDPSKPFTDAFIAQLSGIFSDSPIEPVSSQDSSRSAAEEEHNDLLPLLLSHNSLTKLFTLLTQAFHQTFPHGANSVGKILQTTYRHSSTGHVMGSKHVLVDEDLLDNYLKEAMSWWKGEREARGVCLEEAYKCGTCEFSDGCGWRRGKIVEARERVRMGREREREGGRSRV